jgi:sugar lactone lactonase YvrE
MKSDGESRRPRRISMIAAILVMTLAGTACSGSETKRAESTRSTTGPGAATSSIPSNAPIGTITTIAGNGFANSSGDGGPATDASISHPSVIGFDAEGNLYIADGDVRIRKIDPSGVITTVVGPAADGEPPVGEAAKVEGKGEAVDAQGNLYVVTDGLTKVVKVTTSGDVVTVVGTGEPGFSGDGGPATKAHLGPLSVDGTLAIDTAGNLYVPDYSNNRVRKVDTKGIITTIAGTGKPGFSGDGGPARKAQLHRPQSVSVDAEGNIYVAEPGLDPGGNHRIRRINTRGIITTVAGNGEGGFPQDGALATEVPVGGAQVYADAEDNIYVTDEGYPGIFKVDTEGMLTIIAGTGVDGYSGDGGLATEAKLSVPTTVAIGPDGDLYIADLGNDRIRKVVLEAS